MISILSAKMNVKIYVENRKIRYRFMRRLVGVGPNFSLQSASSILRDLIRFSTDKSTNRLLTWVFESFHWKLHISKFHAVKDGIHRV